MMELNDVADASASSIIGAQESPNTANVPFDFKRLATAVAWNGLLFSPFFFFWFRFLDGRFPGNGPRNVAAKVIVNQLVVAGPINIAYLGFTSFGEELLSCAFHEETVGEAREPTETVVVHHNVTTTATQEDNGGKVDGYVGRSMARLKRRAEDSMMTILVASNLYWIPVNALNFLFVPPTLRVFPTILGSLVWTTFLSYRSHAHELVSRVSVGAVVPVP